jgi:hypothetical protein
MLLRKHPAFPRADLSACIDHSVTTSLLLIYSASLAERDQGQDIKRIAGTATANANFYQKQDCCVQCTPCVGKEVYCSGTRAGWKIRDRRALEGSPSEAFPVADWLVKPFISCFEWLLRWTIPVWY